MQAPLVSVLIPTYNRENLLRQALASALAQTYPCIEVVIFDNASTDDTFEFIQQIGDERVRIYRQTANVGMYPNWNACLKVARGDYVIFLSDDDILESTAVIEMVKAIEGKSDIGMVYSRPKIVDRKGNTLEYGWEAPPVECASEMIIALLKNMRSVVPSGTLLRTRDLLEIGGFDSERFGIVADVAAWIRIVLKRGIVAMVNQPLVAYRRHESNDTNTLDVRKWGKSFRSLGDQCFEQFSESGNISLAGFARTRSYRMGSHYMTGALIQNFRKGMSRGEVFQELWQCRGYYHGFHGFRQVCRVLIEMPFPRPLIQKIRRIRSRLHMRSSATSN